LLGQHFGWRSGFYVFGILGVALGVVLLGLLKEPRRGQSEQREGSPSLARRANAISDIRRQGLGPSLLEIFRNRTVLVLIAVFVGANFVAAIVLTWMPKFLFDKFQMDLALAGFMATACLQA